VALASPSPSIPIPPESTSWLPEGVIWVLGIALVIVVIWIIYAILTEIQKETEERCLVLERKLKVQQTWIDEHEWMESRLSKLSDEIRQDRAQIQSHQKMLKILKHMPSFQVHAATLTVSAAVANPKAAHEIREQMKHSAQTSSVWEKESEVNDGR
jgi:ABC-type lipoprotein release transport system permease subunit